MPHEIVYPQGCRPVDDSLGADELIRRLKTLAHTLQGMGQGMYQQYIPLAIHLADDAFLLHPSRDVQLLIACCIADVLRVYAPDAPYKDPEHVKTIFLFIIKQLSGLKDPKDPAFKRYFYLLDNLAQVKSFNMCFELEDCQEIFCHLFTLMFKIVNDEHSSKVKIFMLDVLCPLITESDVVSNKLLDIILMNIVDPYKSQRKNAYDLAKSLVIKCSDTLEPYIQAFFNHVLILGKEEKGIAICSKVYSLIYELNNICPSVLSAVLPQLECKLKSNLEQERLEAVGLLARMFSEKDSTLAKSHQPLWRAFLGRFNDISIQIRIKCVQYSMHFLLNHPDLRKDITETLKLRQHDAEESVRFEVVTAIVSTAKRDFEVVSQSEDLLKSVKERTRDKKFKIRKEAMSGLALIYRKHLHENDCPQATKKAVTWMKDKILHGYYMTGMEDRLLVERLLNNSLVPYQLAPDERMKKLYHLWGTIDDHASRAFVELNKHQMHLRKHVFEWVDMHKRPVTDELTKEMSAKLTVISRYLPEPDKCQEFLAKFSTNLYEDQNLLLGMEAIMRPEIPCKDCAEIISFVLKKLGQPVMTNLYYNTIKMLLGRISSVMIDYLALRELIVYVEDCLQGGNLIDEIGLHPNTAGVKGLTLLVMLSYLFSVHFFHEDILSKLLSFLDYEDENVAPHVLYVFTFLGKYKRIGEEFPEIENELAPICTRFAETGTPKQAKQAVRCIFVNMPQHHNVIFGDILEKIKENLNCESQYYRTAIVALGHIAFNLPEKYPAHMKNIVSRKIVKELLVKENETSPIGQPHDRDWCNEDNLPDETRSKVDGLKTMARWLLGLKEDTVSAQKTFRMLSAFITHKGDLQQTGKMSKAEMAWLRLTAGCSMLKICEQKGVGDQFSAEQYCQLSSLLLDEVPQVREMFLNKLHKGLNRGVPNKCLPLDFMGFYALTGLWTDKRMKALARQYMQSDINKRREYAKTLMNGPTGTGTQPYQTKMIQQLPNIMPDMMIVFAMPVLTHCPVFTDHTDKDQLAQMQTCLTHILEPLIAQKDTFCFGYYKELNEQMKNHYLSTANDDNNINVRLWTLCDLAMTVLVSKTINFEMRNFPTEPRIPAMYFKRMDDSIDNKKNYLPPDMQVPKKLSPSSNSQLKGQTNNQTAFPEIDVEG
ncbi:sister chromatid cohesion protein PDS5 homolog B [Nilaparvata lugens]|uniref:sister chromatid cohesion protein PDS5 homolog B n=1 Tax=Nilaparvata lugens TaxID=108931 RepID=UPI00193E723B|nr:sister chromatid cohesion protein PDS5 homolog B [Nilaparvata lugens]